MHKTVERNYPEFLELLEELEYYILIVEGGKDKKALNTLDLHNVIAINGRPLLSVIDEVRKLGETPVLLTDFDSAGRKLASRLNSLFQAYKTHPNTRLRKKFMEFGKTSVEDFRSTGIALGLQYRIKKKEGDCHGEIGADINKIHNKSALEGKRCS